MQEYVSQGVEAMGRLAGSADSSLQAMSAHDGESDEPAGRSVDQQISELAEHLQLLYDRTGIAMTSLHESVTFLGDRIGVDTRERLEEMNRAFEARVVGLANLVRSDSGALRREFVRTAEAHDQTIAPGQAVDPVVDTLAESVAQTIQGKLEESMSALAERTEEQARLIDSDGRDRVRDRSQPRPDGGRARGALRPAGDGCGRARRPPRRSWRSALGSTTCSRGCTKRPR